MWAVWQDFVYGSVIVELCPSLDSALARAEKWRKKELKGRANMSPDQYSEFVVSELADDFDPSPYMVG